MNRYVVSAIALMTSAGMAFAQAPKGQDVGPPSAKSAAPGQTKPDEGSAKSVAPGQVKEPGSSASDEAPGQKKMQDRVEAPEKGTNDGKSKSKSSEAGGRDSDLGRKSKRSDRAGKDDEDGKANTKSSQSRNGSDDDRRGAKNADRTDGSKDKRSTSSSREGDGAKQKQAERDGDRRGGTDVRINLKPEQKTKVVTTFKKHHVAPVRDVHINVSIGTVVPRKVVLHPIPQDIVVIAPAYRSYRYFVFDDRIIIVEPASYEIVDIIVIA
ncbi:MAG: DUF1236 domain-containing protein [Hyphomicrobiaceae bacterium]